MNKYINDLNKIQSLLDKGLEHGADFVEFFFEKSNSKSINYYSGKVLDCSYSTVFGVGVRVVKGINTVYGYTNKIDSLETLVSNLGESFNSKREHVAKKLEKKKNKKYVTIDVLPSDVSNEEKLEFLKIATKAMKEESDEIEQTSCKYSEKIQNVWIFNSNGLYTTDVRCNCRVYMTAIVGKGSDMETGSTNFGFNGGFENFKDADFKALGKEAAKKAVTMAHADYIKGGKMTVVVNNGFGGVILHEACVHSLEATAVARGASVFCDKLNTKIASDIVTAVDDGTLPNYWGSLNVDDEGHDTQRNVLIKDGVLQQYLVDYVNARKMKHVTTGSGRRESYKYVPTSRMTNTFFEKGNSSFDEIIKATKKGLFAASMGGGSVEPATGEFNFSVSEGYLIENGKITKPVKGATLIGSGKEILMNVDMIAENLKTDHGMCGSLSGSIPTDVGQPTIRVQNITVGGRNND